MIRTAMSVLARGSSLRQRALVIAGWTIIAAGVLVSPLPGPGGIPVMLVGAMVLLRNSPSARRSYVRWKRRKPAWFAPAERFLRRNKRRTGAG
ncbi:MAG TPA: PGPGW domain-containing protein [Azospirillaceae bacterium]|nr:PGPGW domain-containing protein [Azospirillaceae bacterium]